MTVAVPARQAEIAALAEPVGDLIAHALAEIGVTTVFGVISIHNMPILDAIARAGPHPVRSGARRGRRHEHGGRLCARAGARSAS